MAKYARIVNDVAVDVSGNPAEQFHPDIAKEFVSVPEEVEYGWTLAGGKWQKPEPIVIPERAAYPMVGAIEYQMLFTSAERVAIKAAGKTDPVIADYLDILADQRLTAIDMGSQFTQDALTYMVSKQLLTEERKQEILTGKLK